MLGLGVGEILFIAALMLVVVGPDRLPDLMRQAGKMYGQLRRAADDLRRQFVLEADRQDAEERYQKLQERRQKALEARKRALEAAGDGSVPQDPVLTRIGDPDRPEDALMPPPPTEPPEAEEPS